MRLTLLSLLVAVSISPAYGENPSAREKEKAMNVSHVHVGVKDLPEALRWLDRVWQAKPTFQNERMASVPLGGFTVFFDVGSADTPITLGFDSKNCDADFDAVIARGGVALEKPTDRPWGVRAAYVQGPGALKFEIEQVLPQPK
jgi:catechol 2,3-dioxygenase-like lactoylglutathione lyase family enzyme